MSRLSVALRARRLALIAALASLLVLSGLSSACNPRASPAEQEAAIGLFSSLPIIWSETPSLAGVLATGAPPHWALAALRERGRVIALDTLGDDGPGAGSAGAPRLADVSVLVMAQPRPLSPHENVALDAWVRAGGRLLLFADPMLTQGSLFAPGDRRRPQDIVLISPLLAHWGLALEFDDEQAGGPSIAYALGATLPVALPGRFDTAGTNGDCVPRDGGLAATCRIGRGRVIAIADAALFENGDSMGVPGRREALFRLISALESRR